MHPITVASKRKKIATIANQFPHAAIIDLTSKADQPWVKFSPFYPHGGIPIPYSKGQFACSVEGIWQGLKVFERQAIDTEKFHIQNMKGIKRSSRRFGSVLGHRKGIYGTELLSYRQAREEIYLPAYEYVLKTCLQQEINTLKKLLAENEVVLLDYETNTQLDDLTKPLSHAGLVANFINQQR